MIYVHISCMFFVGFVSDSIRKFPSSPFGPTCNAPYTACNPSSGRDIDVIVTCGFSLAVHKMYVLRVILFTDSL